MVGRQVLCVLQMLLQRLENALLLQPPPHAQQLPVAFIPGRAGRGAERDESLAGVEIDAMHTDDGSAFAVVSIPALEHPRQLRGQLWDEHIGIVNFAEAVLQYFDMPDHCQIFFAVRRVRHINGLKNLECVAQALGGDTKFVQLDDALRIGDTALIAEQIMDFALDFQSGIFEQRRLRL